MKYEKYVIEPEVRGAEELPYHNKRAPGERRVLLEKSLLDEADVYLIVRTVKDVTPAQPEYVETHAHNVNSAYIFLGNGEGLAGLKAEVSIENEQFTVSSPKTVFIPKNMKNPRLPIR